MGKSELQLRDYESAALHFRNAGNQSGYSAAFWEIRNARLNQALPYIGIGLVLLAASVILLGRLRRRRKAAEGPPLSLIHIYWTVVNDNIYKAKELIEQGQDAATVAKETEKKINEEFAKSYAVFAEKMQKVQQDFKG